MGISDCYLDGYGILNITLDSDDWTNITFPVTGVKYFEIQEKTGAIALDYRKSATDTAEWRINVGNVKTCYRDNGASTSGGQVKRVGSSTAYVQIYYEY